MKCGERVALYILSKALALAVALAFLILPSAHAYIVVRSAQSGAEVHWPQGARLNFRANPVNSSGLSHTDVFTIFTTALNRWKQAARGGFDFNYFQGTDTSKFPNYVGSPYDNSVFFTSNGGASEQLPCGVIALTEVWYDPGSGTASKADLRFNDNCYRFTLNPSDTQSRSNIYLADVAVHELGHALGLDHSQSLQSSMIYTAALEMAEPSCDDQAAMIHLYGAAARGQSGTVSGRVVFNGAPVFGAHVQAIQLDRGVAIASTLSEKDGTFNVRGLEPGTYGVLIEPYYPGASSLNSYYSGISGNLCGNGNNFSRTFALDRGKLNAVSVGPGSQASLGDVAVGCTAPGSANNNSETSFFSAPVLTGTNLAAPLATQSAFSGSNDHYYRLNNQSGRLHVTALSFSIFSRADVQIEFLSTSGTRLAQFSSSNVFASPSGYVNYDAQASIELVGAQDVVVHVFSRGTVSTSSFPSGSVGVSSTPYYVLSVSRGSDSASLFAPNARCEAQDLFGAYSSPGDPGTFSTRDNDDDSSGGCGTLGSGPQDPMGPGSLNRLANFMGMICLLVLARRHMLAVSRA